MPSFDEGLLLIEVCACIPCLCIHDSSINLINGVYTHTHSLLYRMQVITNININLF